MKPVIRKVFSYISTKKLSKEALSVFNRGLFASALLLICLVIIQAQPQPQMLETLYQRKCIEWLGQVGITFVCISVGGALLVQRYCEK